MGKGLTVSRLLHLCQDEILKGNGDKYIIISDDDEGNGFHTLFYGFQDDKEELKYVLELEHDHNHTVDDTICLG